MSITRLDRLEIRVSTMETDVHTIKNSLQLVNGNMAKIGEMLVTTDEHGNKIPISTCINSFNEFSDTLNKILKWVKRGIPIITTAAVTSGIVSGKWGAFLGALFH